MSSHTSFTLVALAVIFLGLSYLHAQSVDWTLLPVRSPSGALSHLPVADRELAVKLVRPQLGPLFQGDSRATADEAIRSFAADRVRLGAMSALIVKSSGSSDLCSPTGNCAFWIIDLTHRRILLDRGAVQAFAIAPGSRTPPDIVTTMHGSATDAERTLWRFTGARYEASACATIEYADADGTSLAQPKITPHPCSPEGN